MLEAKHLETIEKKIAEACHFRIAELYQNPVQGAYDLAHLQEIHKRIFQDVPTIPRVSLVVGENFTPGTLRPPVPQDENWIKNRIISSRNIMVITVYSPMDDKTVKRLNAITSAVPASILTGIPENQFKQRLGALYAQLDYIHPFQDGNSRTLRAFTAQIADSAGYELNWNIYDTKYGRETLYLARDYSVNCIAATQHENEEGRVAAQLMRDKLKHFEDVKGIMAFISDAIRKKEMPALDKTQPAMQQPEKKRTKTAPERGGR